MSLDVIVSSEDFAVADAQLSRWDSQGGPTVEPSDRLTRLVEALRDAVARDAFAIEPAEQIFAPDGLLITVTAVSFEAYEAVIRVAVEHRYRAYDPEGHHLESE